MSFIAVHIADAIRRRSKDKTDSPAREAGERFIGLSICDYCENVPKLLRLVADLLEGKPPLYSPGNDWYDGAIKEAYLEACNRMPPPRENQDDEGYEMDDGKIIIRCPYFSEFLDIFRKQNPKLQGVSDSSVRRSLQRLGYPLNPRQARQTRRGHRPSRTFWHRETPKKTRVATPKKIGTENTPSRGLCSDIQHARLCARAATRQISPVSHSQRACRPLEVIN